MPEQNLYKKLIESKVVHDEDGCWWYKKKSRFAAQVMHKGIRLSVRRLSYANFIGDPKDRTVSCRCGNSGCINPHHLTLAGYVGMRKFGRDTKAREDTIKRTRRAT